MPDPDKSDQTPPTVDPAVIAQLQKDMEDLKARATKAEGALLDPSYVEYIATKAAGKITPASQNGDGKDKEKKEIKASDLTPEEFEAPLEAKTEERIAKAVDPVKQAILTERALADVKECAGKYADFWDYREEMTALAKRIPALTAEEAYKLAKAQTGPKEKPKAADAEKPTGMAATRIVRQPAKGFTAKADEAWNRVFGKETVAS